MDYNNLKIPKHVAIICDGNGRWAKSRGVPRWQGHEEGFKTTKKILKYAISRGVDYVSLYLFSTENFKRPKLEVDYIMSLLVDKLKEVLDFLHENEIKAVISGVEENLSPKIKNILRQIEDETKDYSKVANLCFNYGSRKEITDAAMKFAEDYKLNDTKLTEDMFESYLYNDLPPVDYMIRTSGEERISNFMLWQCAYAEFYFAKVYFPDFDEAEFDKAILEYNKRDRRYGGLNNEEENN